MTTGVLEIKGNGLLIMLDKTGDSRMQWDRDNPEEVTKAEARFKELKGKGYLAYSVGKKGDREGEVINKFDPSLERIIMHSPMQGG